MAYFKVTPQKRLSEKEKQETILAVNRGLRYLRQRFHSIPEPKIDSIYDLQRGLKHLSRTMPYITRIAILVKGCTQPMLIYRSRRQSQIWKESQKIADDTGADVREVKRLLLTHLGHHIYGE